MPTIKEQLEAIRESGVFTADELARAQKRADEIELKEKLKTIGAWAKALENAAIKEANFFGQPPSEFVGYSAHNDFNKLTTFVERMRIASDAQAFVEYLLGDDDGIESVLGLSK